MTDEIIVPIRDVALTKITSLARPLLVKVQVPLIDDRHGALVYDERRAFMAIVDSQPLADWVRADEKHGGLKSYCMVRSEVPRGGSARVLVFGERVTGQSW